MELPEAVVAARGRFHVALSGDHTPLRTYQLLAQPPCRERTPWPQIELLWGDERCGPMDDDRSKRWDGQLDPPTSRGSTSCLLKQRSPKMDLFTIISLLVCMSAIFSFINYRYLKLPRTIGLMLCALLLSIGLILAGNSGWAIRHPAADIVDRLDFNRLLLQGMLGFLLFAGALHVEANELFEHKWIIFTLATVGVILSTVLVGLLAWLIFDLITLHVPLIYCLLFGALISPTDPVTVLGILKDHSTIVTHDTHGFRRANQFDARNTRQRFAFTPISVPRSK